ncbi:MAG: hypothetical protein ACREJ6_01485 [Candidatus Methylomirabilis sp.]
MPDWKAFVEWARGQAAEAGGRKALRRRWERLRALAAEATANIPPKDIETLLGKPLGSLDPEQNDLKALVAYAVGKGIVKDTRSLHAALEADMQADPLYFLAGHSGKTFGEKYAPLIARFWLVSDGDQWVKKKSKEYYDVGWLPKEFKGREIRIEVKASAEQPAFRFQQIRHPRLSGDRAPDYDLLLCLGVSAGALEWWAIPAREIDAFAENGKTKADRILLTKHHGKRLPIWNDERGYRDEGWFCADPNARKVLREFACDTSDRLRSMILTMFDR